jgi:hypothetical protein
MPNNIHYGSLPFNEQIDFFKQKLNMPSERWTDIWQTGHNSAFSVAGAMKDDLLNDFRRAVDAAINDGKSITWFKKEFNNIVAKHGWSHTGKTNWRARVIYNTNMRQSYNAGRYEQLQRFAYWRYAHGDSRYPRELHLKWHNTILTKDDPWWETHFPANGWGCKCRVYGVSEHEFNRLGLNASPRPDDGSREWLDKHSGEVHQVPKGIDPGFDYAPKRSENLLKQQALAATKTVYQAPERIVPNSFSTVKGVSNDSLNTVLQAIKQTSSAPQIAQLGQFLDKYQIKSVFIKQAEMGLNNSGAKAIEQAIKDYLPASQYATRQLYTSRRYKRSWGFTAEVYDHVNVKVMANTNLAAADVNELRQIAALAIEYQRRGQPKHSISSVAREFAQGKGNTGTVITWLHEIGHQLHFKAGSPSIPYRVGITRYSGQDKYEWHAEHFTAWVLNRNALVEFNADIAAYFDALMVKVLTKGVTHGQ